VAETLPRLRPGCLVDRQPAVRVVGVEPILVAQRVGEDHKVYAARVSGLWKQNSAGASLQGQVAEQPARRLNALVEP
jgi:hypothetical protein